VNEPTPVSRALAAWPCQSVCLWLPAGYRLAGVDQSALDVYACAGCGSEWVSSQAWTPVDADGVVPAVVEAEKLRAVTSERDAGAAGTADR
jgi:hypothetical protein